MRKGKTAVTAEKSMGISMAPQKSRERNTALDVLRIVGCIGVIGIHILMDYCMKEDRTAASGVIFAESWLRWSVPCFLMLSGFFLFQKDLSLKKVLSKAVMRLFIPLLSISLFITVFGAWIMGLGSLRQCISQLSWESIKNCFFRTLLWELPEPGFWLGYICTAMRMYLLYPILKFICRDEKGANEGRWFLMFLTLTGQMIAPLIKMPIYIYTPIDSYGLFYFLFGYEAFRIREKGYLDKKWIVFICAGGYVVSCIFTWWASVYLDIGENGTFTEEYFGYTSLNVALSAVFVFLLFLSWSKRDAEKQSHKIGKLIRWLSGRTLVIYLVHYLVILKLQTMGIEQKLQTVFGDSGIWFFFSYVTIVFVISLFLAAVCTLFGTFHFSVGKAGKMWYTV